MSSVGKPTALSTITMVTSPACGIPAAPILAKVAVKLNNKYILFAVRKQFVALIMDISYNNNK